MEMNSLCIISLIILSKILNRLSKSVMCHRDNLWEVRSAAQPEFISKTPDDVFPPASALPDTLISLTVVYL